jgi:hypothetical protein
MCRRGDGALVIKVARRRLSAANDALIEFLSDKLRVPRRAIRILGGEHGRQKARLRRRRPPPISERGCPTIDVVLADFLIRNTSDVLTCAGPARAPGRAQADARSVPRAAVAAYKGAGLCSSGSRRFSRSKSN